MVEVAVVVAAAETAPAVNVAVAVAVAAAAAAAVAVAVAAIESFASHHSRNSHTEQIALVEGAVVRARAQMATEDYTPVVLEAGSLLLL